MDIAICDDCIEDLVCISKFLKEYIRVHEKQWNIREYNSGEEFIKDACYTDVVLLDIEMPNVNGIETGNRVKKVNPDLQIIMFTGSDGYVSDSFKIGACRYIEKPFEKEDVIEALEFVEKRIIGDKEIKVYYDRVGYNIKQKSISFIRAFNGYTLFFCGNREYRSERSLKDVEKELDKHIFLRINKSDIVNLMMVTGITEKNILIKTGGELKISRRLYGEVKKTWIEFDLKYGRIKI